MKGDTYRYTHRQCFCVLNEAGSGGQLQQLCLH